ncbi:MAG: SAM-dependent chlorinase/fluorinase [Desulfurococcales archaeon]|nr:SAM-dependent chlorinase/fluorinase [Desulfurococcales archaeon]MCE4605680.1 SAM-dependent chlorinase/fluorinase [Desulfurococcales archaeon]
MKCIGLVTDFGDSPYTGIIRSLAYSIVGGNACIVDIDHSVPSFSILAGAYVVAHTYRWLPRGSIIATVVDPGVGSTREPIAVEAGDYYFIGPNNGVLYPAITREGFKQGVKISSQQVASLAEPRFLGKLPRGRWPLSNTFHGRDIFVPAAALIASGHGIEELGEPLELRDLARSSIDYVERSNSGYRTTVVYIDKFGNTALSAREHSIPLKLGEPVIVETMSGISYRIPFLRTFSDVNPGDLVMYVNSFGHLEIAVNQGNASRKLGLEFGEKITIHVAGI